MPARQIIVKPLGLITQPNDDGVIPPGALRVADGVVMRDVGYVDSAPNRQGGATVGSTNDVVRMVFPIDGGIVMSLTRTSGDVWSCRFDATSGTLPSGISTTGMFSNLGYISPVRALDRVFVNSLQGVFVQDVMTPASGADRTLRRAGLPQPQIKNWSLTSTNGGTLPAGKVASYACVFRRDFASGYTLTSVPSVVGVLINTAGSSQNAVISVNLSSKTASYGVKAGDTVEVYRSDYIPSSGSTITRTDPGNTLKISRSYNLTAADIAAGFVDIEDVKSFSDLGITTGRELYSNPGVNGALGVNRQPSISRAIAVFKGFTFYGGITDRPRLTLDIPAGLGSTAQTELNTDYFRANGIGVRAVTGTVTIGSANVTGVSASHMKGIVAGQLFFFGTGGADFPAGTTVQSAAGSTITMSAVATGSGTGISVNDRIDIDGTLFTIASGPNLVIFLSGNSGGPGYEITCNADLPQAGGTDTYIPGLSISVEPLLVSDPTITARATNGSHYSPPLPEIGLTAQTFTRTARLNFLQWSKDGQPEHVTLSNESRVGSGAIIALAATREALWIFCTDGLFRLSGSNGLWRTDPVDSTLFISGPRAWCVLRDSVYAYTNRGLVKLDDTGVAELTNRLANDILPGPYFTETPTIQLATNEHDDEIVIIPDATAAYVYNVITDSLTRMPTFTDVTAVGFSRAPPVGSPAVIVGSSASGAAPVFSYWNATNSFQAANVQYQPIYGDDPYSTKQWGDATFAFDAASGGKAITPVWNAIAAAGASLLSPFTYDSRLTAGVPRAAPAVGHVISPGYQHGVLSTRMRSKGLCLRFDILAEQTVRR